MFKMEMLEVYVNPDMFDAVRHFSLFVFNISSGNELNWWNHAIMKHFQGWSTRDDATVAMDGGNVEGTLRKFRCRNECQMEDRCGAELIWTRQRGTEDGNSQTKRTEFSGIFTQQKQHFRKQRAEGNTQKFPAVETASTLNPGLT